MSYAGLTTGVRQKPVMRPIVNRVPHYEKLTAESGSTKNFNIGEYLAKLQARMWLSHALCAPGMHHTAQSKKVHDTVHLSARNGAKYSPIKKITGRLAAAYRLHYLPTVILIVILIIIDIPSPTHSFTLGLNPSFSANPPYRSLSFFSFRFHYMDFPDCVKALKACS